MKVKHVVAAFLGSAFVAFVATSARSAFGTTFERRTNATDCIAITPISGAPASNYNYGYWQNTPSGDVDVVDCAVQNDTNLPNTSVTTIHVHGHIFRMVGANAGEVSAIACDQFWGSQGQSCGNPDFAAVAGDYVLAPTNGGWTNSDDFPFIEVLFYPDPTCAIGTCSTFRGHYEAN